MLWLVDGFPFGLTLLSVASHVIYLGNMRRFPFVRLSDPLFVASCGESSPPLTHLFLAFWVSPAGLLADELTLWGQTVLVLVNHYLWFRHFSTAQHQSYARMTNVYDQPDVPSFTEIASYFGLCVWLVPFSLFVSLSASDNVLPTMGSEAPSQDGGSKNKRQSIVKLAVDNVLSALGEVGRTAGWKKPEDRF